jgi:hypothetical protein
MTTTDGFQYDIALSFLSADEQLAVALANELRERFRVFIYSEQQKELAGKDGLVEFSAVFGERSRLCAVLYRPGWGQTKWTGVEETAIKERAFEKGWDFLVVIALDAAGVPPWLPKTKLWLGLERFGLQGAAAVLDARAIELGAASRKETNTERAARLEAERQRAANRERFLSSTQGVTAARHEVETLRALLKRDVEQIAASSPSLGMSYHQTDQAALVRSHGRSFTAAWSAQYSNTLESSELFIRVVAGPRTLGGSHERSRVVKELGLLFSIDSAGMAGWQFSDDPTNRVVPTQEVVADLLRDVIDHANDTPSYDPPRDEVEDYDDMSWLFQ